MIRNPDKNKERLLIALEKHLGIVTEACKEAQISRKQFYVYCNTDADFKATVEEINDMTIDFAKVPYSKRLKKVPSVQYYSI